ncbi:MAG: hypothetical protein J1E83_01440 [Lachnospiraceae bacterium]|nr:hypothetical protein [Lachnospiraceae bacterium]
MEYNKMRLTNPSAQLSAQKLFDYLSAISGKGILSGQQECPRDQTHGDELSYIKNTSGRLPAILGLDYIENDFEGVNERAIAWYERGGIVTICWHWGIPPYGVGYPSSKEEVDMEELLTPGTALHQGMLENMDAVAEALSALCKKEIPVLWRPFHEFDGAWFWWGKGGPEAFKKLWCLMYKRFTEMHGLHNLIWVLGYSHEMHEGWYPGDEYVDIIGGDAYVEGIHEELFNWIKTVTDKPMPRCLHENGPLPEPGLLAQKKVDWCWFLTWHTVHIHEQNSSDYLRYVYNHPYVITLENLPKL